MKSVGERIKEIRKEKGLTQVEIANMTGLRQTTISTIETTDSNPRKDTLELVAKALQCEVSDFYTDKKKPAEISGARERLTNLLASVPEDQAQEIVDLVTAFLLVRKRE